MFPQTTISYVKDFNCHIGTTICFWLFGVPGSLIYPLVFQTPSDPLSGTTPRLRGLPGEAGSRPVSGPPPRAPVPRSDRKKAWDAPGGAAPGGCGASVGTASRVWPVC